MPLKLHRIVFLDLNNEHPCQWHRALLLTLVRSKQRRHDARLSESTNQADIAVMAIFLHSRKRKTFRHVQQTEETACSPQKRSMPREFNAKKRSIEYYMRRTRAKAVVSTSK
jgi:hypothetical protein